MRERPILFSAPMVRALLEGRKTQTRRVVKPQPMDGKFPRVANDEWGLYLDRPNAGPYQHIGKCPYGKPGDRLWVRETLTVCCEGIEYSADGHLGFDLAVCPDYAADLWNHYAHEDGPDLHPTNIPSIHMPRWASRLTLEIAEVRVQRLQEISEADAAAEGVEPLVMTEQDIADTQISDCSPQEKELARLMGAGSFSNKFTYQMLWDEINGADAWSANPWVWAVSFKVVQPVMPENCIKPISAEISPNLDRGVV